MSAIGRRCGGDRHYAPTRRAQSINYRAAPIAIDADQRDVGGRTSRSLIARNLHRSVPSQMIGVS